MGGCAFDLPRSASVSGPASEQLVRDADLADVVEQEPVLEARVVEQRRVDSLGQRQRVVLDALRMLTRPRSFASSASASAATVCR